MNFLSIFCVGNIILRMTVCRALDDRAGVDQDEGEVQLLSERGETAMRRRVAIAVETKLPA